MAGRARRAQGNVPPGRAREAHKLLYEHNGKGDADKAERVAWRRGLARAFAVNLIDHATVEVEGYATDILWLVS